MRLTSGLQEAYKHSTGTGYGWCMRNKTIIQPFATTLRRAWNCGSLDRAAGWGGAVTGRLAQWHLMQPFAQPSFAAKEETTMIQPTPSRSRRVVLSMSAQVHAGQALSPQLSPLPY